VEATTEHAVPRRLDPLAAQDTEDDHERVKKIAEIPARYFIGKVMLVVVASKHLTIIHDDVDQDNGSHQQINSN